MKEEKNKTTIKRSFFDLCLIHKSMLSFAVITGIGSIIDIILFSLLYDSFGVNLVLANTYAFFIAALWNFFISRKISFADDTSKTKTKLLKYCVIASVGLVINTFVVWGAMEPLELGSILSKILAAFFTFIWSYSANKHWTFKV